MHFFQFSSFLVKSIKYFRNNQETYLQQINWQGDAFLNRHILNHLKHVFKFFLISSEKEQTFQKILRGSTSINKLAYRDLLNKYILNYLLLIQ